MLVLLLAAALPQEQVSGRFLSQNSVRGAEVDRGVRPASRPVRDAVEAERAFADDARVVGQWTAFRKWASPNATLFVPRPRPATEALKDAVDPPRAVRWTPAASYRSCDGTMAANTGPWTRADGSVGFFTTIWIKRAEGWRWDVDGGDRLATPRAAPRTPLIRNAACSGPPPRLAVVPPDAPGVAVGFGHAPDDTLQWAYRVEADGARRFTVDLWDGSAMQRVIDDRIATPAQQP